nr:replication protein A 70 kDa DNA-binding subunit B-like [Ipomoea batatas]
MGGSNDLVVTQIEEIYSKKKFGEYWVAGRIVDVESVVDWYYVSCKDNYCKRKLIEKDVMMVCDRCKSSWHEGVVRYKVIVRVADDIGDAPMLIWDRECSDLVGVSASDLLAKYPEVWQLRVTTQPSQFLAFAEMKMFLASIVQICWEAVKVMDLFSSDEEDCVAVEEVSQCSGLEKVIGLEDFEEGFGVDGVDVTLKISLLKDFDCCGSSKKSKGIAVNEEK